MFLVPPVEGTRSNFAAANFQGFRVLQPIHLTSTCGGFPKAWVRCRCSSPRARSAGGVNCRGRPAAFARRYCCLRHRQARLFAARKSMVENRPSSCAFRAPQAAHAPRFWHSTVVFPKYFSNRNRKNRTDDVQLDSLDASFA